MGRLAGRIQPLGVDLGFGTKEATEAWSGSGLAPATAESGITRLYVSKP